jgi:hypothetical protein
METYGEEGGCSSLSLVEDINHNTFHTEVEEMEEGEASFLLPQEVWLQIFGSLSEKDLFAVAQVRGGGEASKSNRYRAYLCIFRFPKL